MNPSIPTLLSVTAATASDGQTCDLHLRWSDGSEERINQNEGLKVYAASAKQRAANAVQPPTANNQPWCGWFLAYADAYDKTHGGPPAGYIAPVTAKVVEPDPKPEGQTSLFPVGGQGIEVVSDPRILRQRALEAMEPGDYKAAAKAAGVQGYSRMKKAGIIAAILVAEFDKPVATSTEEPAPEEPTVVEQAPQAEPAPAPEEPKKSKRLTKAQVIEAGREMAASVTPSGPSEPHVVTEPEPTHEEPKKRARKGKTEPAPGPGAGIVAQVDSSPASTAPTIQDREVRPEVASVGLGGSGVELGGGMGLGGGTELGGGLGMGEGELTGGLTGESVGGIGGEGRDDTPTGIKHRAGAGCKQPDKVDGWEAGRVLVVVKPHRGEFKEWGTCEYRVRCEDDGTYTLIKFSGARKPTDVGNIFEGKHWDYVSQMLTDLMGIPRDPETGKPAHHHRMTLRRWFALGRAA